MTEYAEQPLLFLDVDGTVVPFGQQNGGRSATTAEPYLDGINPDLGSRLAELPCELVWATTWENDANIGLAPRLGLATISKYSTPGSAEP